MEFDLLGTLRVRTRGGRVVDLGPPKRRVLLAVLLARVGEVVSAQLLQDAVWPTKRPRHPHNALQVNAHRLRRLLDDPERITCRAGGYRLEASAGEIDWQRFAGLADEARRVRDAGQLRTAGDLLRQALSLWRGRPFAEFDDVGLLRIEAEWMTEQWIAAHEELAEVELATGSHAGVAARLKTVTAEHPFRERAQELLMLALVRSGCPGEALRHYQALRERFAHELGADPSVRLRRLHHSILVEDPGLRESGHEVLSSRLAPARGVWRASSA